MSSFLEGGCFCGAIRYRLTAPIVRTGACHCRKCQYGAGGGPNYSAAVTKTALEIVRGSPRAHLSVADSGAEVARYFCADCGTPLYSETPNLPVYSIRVGSLDDPAACRPTVHIWTEAAPPWHAFEPMAARFVQGPPRPPSAE